VLFTAVLSLLAALLFGLVPAMQVTRGTLAGSIRDGGRGTLSGRSGNRVRGTLVVAEMALSVMLLSGAGLLIRSFSRLQAVDPGFASEGLVSFGVSLPDAAYEGDERRVATQERLLAQLRGLPGVRSAAAVSDLPLSGGVTYLTFEIEGRPEAPNREDPAAQILRVTPDYFRTMGIPLRKGRVVDSTDRSASTPVVVINERAAREYFAGEEPVGQRIRLGLGADTTTIDWEIVGVVGDVQQFGLDAEATPMTYFPATQAPVRQMDFVVSTSVPPLSLANAIRREVKALDPNLPVTDLQTVEQRVSESISQPRFYTLLLTIFAGVALVLAAIGIFGVVSYGVSQRTREIGVRMALGALPGAILRRTVAGALLLGGAGVVLGLLAALAGTSLLDSLLFGVGSTDPLTFVSVAAILLGVAMIASYLPARRATRVDPMVALRAE
jgi:putative ABC transport system permease protein